LVEERYDRDVPVIENVFVKREGKGRESNVYTIGELLAYDEILEKVSQLR